MGMYYLIYTVLNLAMVAADVLAFFLGMKALDSQQNHPWVKTFSQTGHRVAGRYLGWLATILQKGFHKTLSKSYLLIAGFIGIAMVKILIAMLAGWLIP